MLIENWHRVLLRAWSVRFILAAGLLSGFEIAWQLLAGYLPISPVLYAITSGVLTCAAFIARIIPQQNLTPKPTEISQ